MNYTHYMKRYEIQWNLRKGMKYMNYTHYDAGLKNGVAKLQRLSFLYFTVQEMPNILKMSSAMKLPVAQLFNL